MNKEQQIEEIEQFIYDYVDSKQTEKVYLFSSRVIEFVKVAKPFTHNKGIAEALYNAGYRKTFTSDLASDTQKAYKEGYIKGIEDREAENERLTKRLKQVLLSIDTVKEMNAMCNIDEQRKQAVKEFAEKLQKELPCQDYTFNGTTYSMVLTSNIKYVIDKLLKEYEQ
nr:MAG TPA: hypothetical protein [Caudoviricetes sp.]